MKEIDRRQNLLESMVHYCDDIDAAHRDFGGTWEDFRDRSTYQNAVGLCVLQVGELSKSLPEDFKDAHPQIPWRELRELRNFLAHQYGSVDRELLWNTATEEIPRVREFCRQALREIAREKKK